MNNNSFDIQQDAINWDDTDLTNLTNKIKEGVKGVKKIMHKDQINNIEAKDNWFKVNRQVFYNYDLTKKPELLCFFLWLVSKAFFEPTEYDGRIWERGEGFVGSGEALAKFSWLTPRKYRTLVQQLNKCHFATSKATNKGTEFLILNYNKYQGSDKQSDRPNDKQNDKQPTTIKNDNNYLKKKEKYIKRNRILEITKNSVSDYEIILGVYYFELRISFKSVEELKSKVLEDNKVFSREIKAISSLKLEEYQPIMANLSQKGELTLDNVVQYIQQKSVKQGEKVDELRQDLVDKLGFDF